MSGQPSQILNILERLCSFEPVSDRCNLDLIHYCKEILESCGFSVNILPDASGTKANLHASRGEADKPGLVFAGHTDVVPVQGQSWQGDPFQVRLQNGFVIGRGVVDMLGYVATVLSAMSRPETIQSNAPVHVLLTHDEETGCFGARDMQGYLSQSIPKGSMCLLGEPTDMVPVVAHKGILGLETTIFGSHGHAAQIQQSSNAIHFAADLVAYLKDQGAQYAAERHSGSYVTPHSTVQVGLIKGGAARNMIADTCRLEYEFRHLPQNSAEIFAQNLDTFIAEVLHPRIAVNEPNSSVETRTLSKVPAFQAKGDGEFLKNLHAVLGHSTTEEWDGVTEAGLYAQCGLETVVCGPGSLSQAHQPNEQIALKDLLGCERCLVELIAVLHAK